MRRVHSHKRLIQAFLVGVSLFLLTGCGGRLGDFTYLTTKQFNLPVTTMAKGARVKGEDCSRNVLLYFTIGHVQPSTKEAVDQAIEKEDANALIDVVVEWNWFHIILYGENCITVEGTAVKLS